MRYVLLLCGAALLASPAFAELTSQDIKKMVKEIKAKRTSKLPKNAVLKSPFLKVNLEENVSTKVQVASSGAQPSFTLGAVVNRSAFIDGVWRKAGDTIGDFRLKSVAEDRAILVKKNRSITLYFKATKPILKINKEQE